MRNVLQGLHCAGVAGGFAGAGVRAGGNQGAGRRRGDGARQGGRRRVHAQLWQPIRLRERHDRRAAEKTGRRARRPIWWSSPAPAWTRCKRQIWSSPRRRVDVARALIGVGVRAGAPGPDLSTPETFKAALLKARSVSYVNPASGGTSGTYFEGLLQRMGIAEAMKPKIVYRTQGSEVADAVAKGEAEFGISFTSELQPNKGVKVAGTLPAAIQLPTIYAAAIPTSAGNGEAARAFLKTLSGAEARAALIKAGLEPVGARCTLAYLVLGSLRDQAGAEAIQRGWAAPGPAPRPRPPCAPPPPPPP